MSNNKTKLSENNKVIQFEKATGNIKDDVAFSKGFYHWIMFVIDFCKF